LVRALTYNAAIAEEGRLLAWGHSVTCGRNYSHCTQKKPFQYSVI